MGLVEVVVGHGGDGGGGAEEKSGRRCECR